MKKFFLLMSFFTSMVAYARVGEIGTKTFENVTGYCENGKLTSYKPTITGSKRFYIRMIYPLCRIDGLRYRNIKFSYVTNGEFSNKEELNDAINYLKNINLDGYNIDINYDNRTIYTRLDY